MFLGAFGTDLGVFGTRSSMPSASARTSSTCSRRSRGDRLMYAYFRPGGVAWDVPRELQGARRVGLPAGADRRQDLDKLLTDNEIFIVRTRGIGILNAKDAINFGATGPVLRASRRATTTCARDEPYSIYDRFDFEVPDRHQRRLLRPLPGASGRDSRVGQDRAPGLGADARRPDSARAHAAICCGRPPARFTCAARTLAASTVSTSCPRGRRSPIACASARPASATCRR